MATPPGSVVSRHEPLDSKTGGIFTISEGKHPVNVDIVFVHGLGGHLSKTWTKQNEPPQLPRRGTLPGAFSRFWRSGPDSSQPVSPIPVSEIEEEDCFWPRKLLPQDFPNARILTYGYESTITHFLHEKSSDQDIITLGRDLLNSLASKRKGNESRPVIFVAHSMGGLVVKSCFFFGTPHRGSDWTKLGKKLALAVPLHKGNLAQLEKLDQALTRPGRIDMEVEFQLADRGIAKDIFRFMFGQPDKQMGYDNGVESQADEFASKIPESEFSPAEIMSYLLPYRSCPAAAVENCGRWVDGLLKEKKGKRDALKRGSRNQRS